MARSNDGPGTLKGGQGLTARMNNVNAAEMQKFVAALQKDPSLAKKNKRVTGTWSLIEGTPQFSTQLEFPKGKATVNVELPSFAGGWGTSPDPIQVCLSGLAACFAVTYAAVATADGVQLTRLQVTAENWMDLRKQMGVSKDNIIERVKFTVEAAGAPRETLERLLRLAEERCPGTECVTRAIPLSTELKTSAA
jgi:uncharacterized OsmC-like protein